MHILGVQWSFLMKIGLASVPLLAVVLAGCAIGGTSDKSEKEISILRGVLFRDIFGGMIESIIPASQVGEDSNELYAFSQEEGVRLQIGETVSWRRRYHSPKLGFSPSLIRQMQDGPLQIVKSGIGDRHCGVLDLDGKLRWSYKSIMNGAVNRMIAEDLEDDGTLDFYVASEVGLSRLDDNGRILWTRGEPTHYVIGIKDPVTNKNAVVVQSGLGGELSLYDSTGQILRKIQTPVRLTDLVAVNWNGQFYLVGFRDSKVYIFDLKEDKKIHIVSSFPIFGIRARVVKFGKKETILAILVHGSSSSNHAEILLLNGEGIVVHRDQIGTLARSMAIMASPTEGNEMVMVGTTSGTIVYFRFLGKSEENGISPHRK